MNKDTKELREVFTKNLPMFQRGEGEQLIDKVFSPFTFHFSRKRAAFTLAEVLITLGIIGVVATMTIPVLINKYQEQVTVNKVKKFYSMINQALLMSIKDNGYIDEWQYSNVTEFADYLKPYLKIIKDCGTQSGCLSIGKKIYLSGNGTTQSYDSGNYYRMILADNSYMWFRKSFNNNSCIDSDGGWSNICGLIFIDINGNKKPNTFGKDTFVFYIQKSAIITSNQNAYKCDAQNSFGYACASYILTNGNMDYLHK